MKYLSILFLLSLLISCKEETSTSVAEPIIEKVEDLNASPLANTTKDYRKNKAYAYINNLEKFTNTSNGNPIEKFQELAAASQVETMVITKKSFADALKTAANYKVVFITVENHTVVLIEDLTNCKPSASWATCVPYASGYIKKGEMVYQEDYANHIIGIPDNKKRTMYLFK